MTLVDLNQTGKTLLTLSLHYRFDKESEDLKRSQVIEIYRRMAENKYFCLLRQLRTKILRYRLEIKQN